jgi:hypothetical protein
MTKTHTKRGRAVPRALAEDCRMQPNICTPLSALGRAPPTQPRMSCHDFELDLRMGTVAFRAAAQD